MVGRLTLPGTSGALACIVERRATLAVTDPPLVFKRWTKVGLAKILPKQFSGGLADFNYSGRLGIRRHESAARIAGLRAAGRADIGTSISLARTRSLWCRR